MVYPIFKKTILPLFGFFIKEVKGTENIPKGKPFIMVANHESWIDGYLLAYVVVKSQNKKIHFFSQSQWKSLGETIFNKWAGCIPVFKEDSGKSAYKEGLTLLKNNEIIGIFPYIPDMNNNPKYKTGAIRLAIEGKVPILPVALIGIDEIYSGPITIKTIFPKKLKRIKINIGKPLYFDKHYNKEFKRATLRRLINRVMKIIRALGG